MSGGREGKEELNIPSGIKRREGGGDVKVDFLFSVIRTGNREREEEGFVG